MVMPSYPSTVIINHTKHYTLKVTELKLCVKSFAPIYGENSRIKSNAKVLNSKIDQLKANYSVLSGEFQEISTSL